MKPGEWVERGAVLGLCGNSGYSPQPHIHVQVQASDSPEAATFADSASWAHQRRPAKNSPRQRPAVGRPAAPDRCTSSSGSTSCYDLPLRRRPGVRGPSPPAARPAGCRIRTVAADDGTCVLPDAPGPAVFPASTKARSISTASTVPTRTSGSCCWPCRGLPLATRPDSKWQDYVPLSVATSGVRRFLARVRQLLLPASGPRRRDAGPPGPTPSIRWSSRSSWA